MNVARLAQDDRGAVYVEFLMVFMPIFLLFLAAVELGMVYAARLVVQHAANRAARAAVVVLDDDPARYGGERRGRVELTGAAAGPSPVDAFLAGVGLGGGIGDAAGGARFRDIRSAAFIPLLAVAPSNSALDPDESLVRALGGGRTSASALRYSRAALAVTFPAAPRAGSFRTSFGPEEPVTVRVTYLFHCSVPLVPQLMCDGLSGLRTRLLPEEQAQLDLALLSQLGQARFLVLRAEATLPNQGAGYLYAGEAP
jgi:hypothetical protein